MTISLLIKKENKLGYGVKGEFYLSNNKMLQQIVANKRRESATLTLALIKIPFIIRKTKSQPKLLLVDRDVVALLQSREASVVTGRAIMGVVNA